MVRLLIQHGAKINKKDEDGWTPLHAAAANGLHHIARYHLTTDDYYHLTRDDYYDLTIDRDDSVMFPNSARHMNPATSIKCAV